MLMVSGVLRQVVRKYPERRFNLIRRTRYTEFLGQHEAIEQVGFPEKGDTIVGVDYWAMEKLGSGRQRAYQVLARSFGLDTPIEEELYLPGYNNDEDILFHGFLPFKATNIVIAPATDSPRKAMRPELWHRLVDMLTGSDVFIMQVGLLEEIHIRNAYSVQGQTTPQQLLSLLKKCDLVVTSDNFVMHAAHLAGTPAVVVWGPTHHDVYGYPEQFHLQFAPTCDLKDGETCIVSNENKEGFLYVTPCPMGDKRCMNQVDIEELYGACLQVLSRSK